MNSKKILELIERSIDWNRRKLPENTFEMQARKVIEELEELVNELEKDNSDEIKINREKADLFIASSGLGRFRMGDCLFYVGNLLTDMERTNEIIETLISYVEEKLDLIEQLDYVIQDGVYHHKLLN